MGGPGCDIVGFAGRSLFHDHVIRADDIADIGEVPFRFQVADIYNRVALASLNCRNLFGECRRDETLILAGPDVIKGPGAHDR